MRATAVLLVILVAVLAAALRPGIFAVVAVEGEHYRPGESAAVRLHNRSREPLGYNACSWTLERRGEVGWRPAPHESTRVCTMELRSVAAGGSAQARFPLDARLTRGRYRLRAALHGMDSGARTVQHSNAFRIAP